MADENRYEAPTTEQVFGESEPGDQHDVCRDGPLLVVRRGCPLPDRCVKCNQPAGGRRFAWYVGTSILRPHSVRVEMGLCRTHQFRVWKALAAPYLGLAFGIGLIVVYAGSIAALMGFLAIPLYFIAGYIKLRSRTLSATKIGPRFLWLKGAHADYLDELPVVSSTPSRVYK